MPSLSQHQSGGITKLMLMGDSGTAKTGSLVSLVKDGYALRILDFDNGLDPLVHQIRAQCPDKLSTVAFRTLRDKLRASPVGPVTDGQPKAFINALNMLDRWKFTDDDESEDLGVPATWGAETILVIDSLTLLSEAAFRWAESMNPGAKDRRQIYGAAQSAVESMIALLTSESFNTNVIVIAHTKYLERPDGTTKGFPTAVGNALSPKLPAYFNSVAWTTTTGSGANLKRRIQTISTALIDLKNPSVGMPAELDLNTGLATFFKQVRSK